jgi:hypothetical protein
VSYLDIVSLISSFEDYLLKLLDPLYCAGLRVGTELVAAILHVNQYSLLLFVILISFSRDRMANIDCAAGKVEIRRVIVIRENVVLQDKPIPVPSASCPGFFIQVARLNDSTLHQYKT